MFPLINRDNSCCFSGYRPEKLPWGANESDPRCEALKGFLLDAVERLYLSGIRHFICGMARGCDTYFCEAVLSLRMKHSDITLEAAIPCEEQALRWSQNDRDRYNILVGKCDYVTYVEKEYSRGCMHRRNRYMVDNSSVLLAVYDGKSGGTIYTINYAARRGLEVIEITPPAGDSIHGSP